MITNYFSNRVTPLSVIEDAKAGCLVYIEDPSEEELTYLEGQGLDIDLLRDGLDPNEAPRIEDWDKRTYIYSRYVLPATAKQTTTPVLIVFGVDTLYVVTKQPFEGLIKLINSGQITTSKRAQTLLQILNIIQRSYKLSILAIAKRIWQIRSQLNKSEIKNEDFISFIDLEEDLNDFLLALEPMNTLLNHLLTGKSIRLYEDDRDLMEDLELGSEELINQTDSQLKTIKNIREAYSTITANNLNKVFKLMTSITILMGIFTLITGVYSMNIALPAAHNPQAFWIIFSLTMGLIGQATYFFRKNKWL